MHRSSILALSFVLAGWSAVRADGPADNQVANVRRVPKPGIDVPADVAAELRAGLVEIEKSLEAARGRNDARAQALEPDVLVFHKAVHDALEYGEFFDAKEFDKARVVLKEGQRRARVLAEGASPDWASSRGLVVRGYRSKIDGSVQPYGLVVPETYDAGSPHRHRLDLWFHGRGELLSELNFIHDRMTRPGEFAPDDAFVLHPYGRFCNAFKFAGEVDVDEALAHAEASYRIDADRIASRGFSMGGAAAWQFAVHNPTRYFAANPGAGFSETPRFLKVFQKETLDPPWYERTLWNLYDCDKWAGNLRMLPTVAYSGEDDNQKQAADVMAEALRAFGVELTHIIGPKTGHKYEAGAKAEVERRMNELARVGRRMPRQVEFTTYTLRYNRAAWVMIDGMEEHWKPATIRAYPDRSGIQVTVENVDAFTLDFAPGEAPFLPQEEEPSGIGVYVGNGQPIPCPFVGSDRSWRASFHKEGGVWKLGARPQAGPRKTHGLQGPIDDAFLDSFVFVRPTGTSLNPKVAEWVDSERKRAVERWRRQMRGVAREVDDTALTEEQIASNNLVLWGDPASNAVLAKIADRLPIAWGAGEVRVGDRTFGSSDHAVILVSPNPLNPARYVVLNSGFTYREYDDLNNARQTPKLPDWAVIDLKTPADARWPGKVVDAGFFGERWELKPAGAR